MPSPEAIAAAIALCRSARLANAPVTDDDADACAEVWLLQLRDIPDDAFETAVHAHLDDRDRGRWWPTPADIRARAPLVSNTHVEAWERILDALHHGDRSSGSLPSVEGLLDAVQAKAFQLAGGMWALRNANQDQVHWVRDRFLRVAQRLSGGQRAIPGPRAANVLAQAPPQARATLAGFFGPPEESGRAAHRARLVEQARAAAGDHDDEEDWR
jgi:hypothetical protein